MSNKQLSLIRVKIITNLMKPLIFITFILFLFSCSVPRTNKNLEHSIIGIFITTEVIDGPANIRENLDGKISFELYDGVSIQTTKIKNNWYQIGQFFPISKNQYDQGKLIQGDYIITNEGDTLGKAVVEVPFWTHGISEDGPYAFIAGYTHKKNINPNSIVENQLVKIIQDGKISLSEFKPFIDTLGFQRDDRFMHYDSYFIYENWITDPSPGYRILLLFEQDSLAGIMHTRHLPLVDLKPQKIWNDSHVTFMAGYDKTKQVKFINYISNWLQGVD
ncbi:MAG: hypothetical protein ACJAZ2_000363 [Glaciecola sp.]|jgi:hypothetical protein